MKFSVVTISFNQAEFLERTIQSVISQKGVEIDYIMVDPGSTDGSRDIIERYKDRFSHVILEKDRGPADGLNRGFAAATGDVFCYLNSDDTFEPDAFATAARYLGDHPEFDVVCGHAWVTDRQDRRLRRVWSEPYRPLLVAYGAAVQIQPSTFIRKAAFLRSGGFNVENRSNWDGELLLSLHQSGARIGIVDAFLSCYRLHETSITNSGALETRIRAWRRQQFERMMGRSFTRFDTHIARGLRMVKHISAPRAALERLSRGPIYRRNEK